MWSSQARAALAAIRKIIAPADGPGSGKMELIASWSLVLLGWFFRSRGMLFGPTVEMWNDEASWAVRVFERPLAEHLIRPPGYVLLTRLTAWLFGYREFGFRFLPWLFGMVAPVLAVLLARRFLRSAAARVLFVAILSLSFYAIEFSREFKQYSIGLTLQLLLALLVLRWVSSRSRRDLGWVCGAAVLGLMFSQDVMFLYPGLFSVLLVESWLGKDKKELRWVVGAGAATFALVVGMYLLVWSRLPKEKAEQHWGARYDVFYLQEGQKGHGEAQGSRGAWTLEKYRAIAAMPGARRDSWSPDGVLPATKLELATSIDTWCWVALHVIGLGVLFLARRRRELLLFWSPILVCFALNLAGRWPIGQFRTNLFLLAGTSALACCALEWLKPSQARWHSFAPAVLLVVLPIALFERNFHASKWGAYDAGVLGLLQDLRRERGPAADGKQPLYMDTHACQPFKYYSKYHPDGARAWHELEPKVKPVCAAGSDRARMLKTVAKLDPGQRVWLLFSRKVKLPRSLKLLGHWEKAKQTLMKIEVR